ncbi:MAG: PaaI family thioesterase [Gemmatimonadota bacterium]|nr:PaaI family thioesterase [Gemmatimonadota bacterium]MDE2871100.1 PaaI family thioesterase [Gemmatimonadota bacterium]
MSRRRPANTCFVCGPDNPIGLHLVFRLEDGACVSEFTPGGDHVGYPGVVHGGMIYSALDDVMANWLYLRGARAYTARCEIRYREPAVPGETLLLSGRPTARRRKVVEMEGTATRASDGKVVATATATFVVIDEGEFSEGVDRVDGAVRPPHASTSR